MWGTGILKGMRVTWRNLIRGPITVQYPDERLELPERARWAVIPLYEPDGAPKCTACMTCVRECPDEILALDVTTREDKTKHIDDFTYEVGACMMCGLCVEGCPFNAIAMGHDYELAVTDPELMTVSVLRDVDAASAKRARAEQPAAPEAERPAPEGGDGDA